MANNPSPEPPSPAQSLVSGIRRAADRESEVWLGLDVGTQSARALAVTATGGGDGSEADRFAAVLQGVGYVERLCYDYLDLLGAPIDGDLVLTGGATKSNYWCQLRADILGRPVSLPENSEPALGMAVLAASAGRDAADVAAEMVRIRVTIDPRAGSAERFEATYMRFVDELEGRGWLGAALAAHDRGDPRAREGRNV